MGTFKITSGTQNPHRRKWMVHLAISAAFVLAVIVYVLAPVLAWQWIRNPFLGVFLEPTLVISDVHNPDWPARRAGLRNADRLLAIDGQSVATGRDVAAVLRQRQPGQTVTLTVEKDPAKRVAGDGDPEGSQPPAEVIGVEIPLITFPPGDFLRAFGFPYLLGLLYLVLGITVYWVRWALQSIGCGGENAQDRSSPFSLFFLPSSPLRYSTCTATIS
jgi:membrane-associated protease RseP (regulator of RpoE activity)